MKKLKFLFSRMIFVIFAVFVEAVFAVLFFTVLSAYNDIIRIMLTALSFLIFFVIINKESHPEYKMAWLIPVLAFPLFGGLLYLLCCGKAPTAKMRNSLNRAEKHISRYVTVNTDIVEEIAQEDRRLYGQVEYISKYAGAFPVYKNTDIKYYGCGEEIFPVFLEELDKAKHFIFMEYFIINHGEMWDEVLAVLKKKAAEGVDVRLIYDDFGSINYVSKKYNRELESYGIKCEVFNRIRPLFSACVNNRDHRKITVIDGFTGFMGGWNIADEYINRISRFGYWKDSGLMLRGDAVESLTAMFLTTWNSIRFDENCNLQDYAPRRYAEYDFENSGYVQPFGDTPLDKEIVSESVFLNIINTAHDYVYITSPYLIIDSQMINALKLAAKRGVDIRIITPGIPDKKLTFHLTRSYYHELTKAGVKIYQFTPGFIHAKSIVSDDRYAIVGTINMDYRSLFLHFECGTLFADTMVVFDVKDDILRTIEQSEYQTMDMVEKNPFLMLLKAVLRVFAPLF